MVYEQCLGSGFLCPLDSFKAGIHSKSHLAQGPIGSTNLQPIQGVINLLERLKVKKGAGPAIKFLYVHGKSIPAIPEAIKDRSL